MHQDHYNRHRRRSLNTPRRAPRPFRSAESVEVRGSQDVLFWPALMSTDQVGAYLGIHPDTFIRHAAVSPVKLGARLLRWRRSDIDRWIEGMRPHEGGVFQGDVKIGDTTARALSRVLARTKRMRAD